MKTRQQKRDEAAGRQSIYNALTTAQKIFLLPSSGAKRQRERLVARLEAESLEKVTKALK